MRRARPARPPPPAHAPLTHADTLAHSSHARTTRMKRRSSTGERASTCMRTQARCPGSMPAHRSPRRPSRASGAPPSTCGSHCAAAPRRSGRRRSRRRARRASSRGARTCRPRPAGGWRRRGRASSYSSHCLAYLPARLKLGPAVSKSVRAVSVSPSSIARRASVYRSVAEARSSAARDLLEVAPPGARVSEQPTRVSARRAERVSGILAGVLAGVLAAGWSVGGNLMVAFRVIGGLFRRTACVRGFGGRACPCSVWCSTKVGGPKCVTPRRNWSVTSAAGVLPPHARRSGCRRATFCAYGSGLRPLTLRALDRERFLP